MFSLKKQILGDLKKYLAIEMSLNNAFTHGKLQSRSDSTKRHADNSGNHVDPEM